MYRHATTNVPGIVRATRYELYRVLMFETKYAPRFLTLYEIDVDSAEQARHSADLLVHFDDTGHTSEGYIKGESDVVQRDEGCAAKLRHERPQVGRVCPA